MTTKTYEVTFKVELTGAMEPAEASNYIEEKLRNAFHQSSGIIKWSDLVVRDMHRGRILKDG